MVGFHRMRRTRDSVLVMITGTTTMTVLHSGFDVVIHDRDQSRPKTWTWLMRRDLGRLHVFFFGQHLVLFVLKTLVEVDDGSSDTLVERVELVDHHGLDGSCDLLANGAHHERCNRFVKHVVATVVDLDLELIHRTFTVIDLERLCGIIRYAA